MIDAVKLANALAKSLHPNYGRSAEAMVQRDRFVGVIREELKRQMLEARDDLEEAVRQAELSPAAHLLTRQEVRAIVVAARAAGPQSGAWVSAESVRELAAQLDEAMNGKSLRRDHQLCDVVARAVPLLRVVGEMNRRGELWVERAYLGDDGMPTVERLPISAMPAWLQQLYGR